MKNSVSSRRRSKRSRGRRRGFFAIVTILAVILAGVWIARGLHRNAPHTALANAAPVPTPHPAPPAAPWTPSQQAQVRTDLREAFAPAIDGIDSYSLVVIDAGGRVLYEAHSAHAVTPASVQKLVVADAALNLLGPSFRFHTIAAAQHPIDSNGTLEGNLWLVGSGDPSFRSDDLHEGVATLKRLGLKNVAGRVAVDPSAVRGPEINPHWSADDANEDFQTATSAISLDGDTAEFRVYGGAPGEAARVSIVPKSGVIHTSGSVTTSSSDNVIIAAMEAPNTFRYGGTIPAYTEEKFWLPVHDIPNYVGSVTDRMLRDAGIVTSGAPVIQPAPLDSIVLWDHRSAPLTVLEKHMLYESDNHYAEQLLRSVGGDAGAHADDRDGITAETQFLHSRSIPTPGMRLFDGSGLAEANRISAITLARILSDAELRDGGMELEPLLPQGGKDGTLKHYDFTTAMGRVRAKTGHLSDAASLAGYVDTRHHGRLAFAFMINGSPGDPDAAYVRAVDRLAGF